MSNRHGGVTTPYKWQITQNGGWRIGFGQSGLLVAEGAGWSINHGRKMYRALEKEFHKRPDQKNKKKARV